MNGRGARRRRVDRRRVCRRSISRRSVSRRSIGRRVNHRLLRSRSVALGRVSAGRRLRVGTTASVGRIHGHRVHFRHSTTVDIDDSRLGLDASHVLIAGRAAIVASRATVITSRPATIPAGTSAVDQIPPRLRPSRRVNRRRSIRPARRRRNENGHIDRRRLDHQISSRTIQRRRRVISPDVIRPRLRARRQDGRGVRHVVFVDGRLGVGRVSRFQLCTCVLDNLLVLLTS